jgi:primosomal protein N' (replication factor Y) (superfamily II helicase)
MNGTMWDGAATVAELDGLYETGSVAASRWVEVLVDCPRLEGETYTYSLPAGIVVQPGDILSVPFGAAIVGAIAIRAIDELPLYLKSDSIRIKPIEDVVCGGLFSPFYWQVLEKVARYYCTSLVSVVRVALPPGLLDKSQRRIRLNPDITLPSGADTFLNPAAKKILEILQAKPEGDYSYNYLQRQVRNIASGVRDLIRRGWVVSYLEHPQPIRPKLRQSATLVADTLPLDLTRRQAEVLQMLKREGGEMWVTELIAACQTSSTTVKALAQKGYLVIQEREILRLGGKENLETSPTGWLGSGIPGNLTLAQTQALETINGLQNYAEILLHGVTGSGKTEVYLQAIAPILARGKSALVLVPEIGLTPQLTARFRDRFGSSVCVYHSALGDGERYDTWRQMLTGEPQVAIGTRSAVFAPLPQIGLIILDEEHDSSFKQDRPAPTYHARLVARWRAELEDCPLILGSATPGVDTWNDFQKDGERELLDDPLPQTIESGDLNPIKYYLSLPDRIHSRPLPPIEVIDMRQELAQGNRSIFSRSLYSALTDLKNREQQGILFIHRRGHSTFVSCRSCGYVIECPHCDVSLSYHHVGVNAPELLRCHYCNFTRSHPQSCPECTSPYLKFFGSGTQKIVEEINKEFPQLRCLRFDSDTTRTKGAHGHLLTKFARREADLLVGTQMLAKGLDLPQVTLVGVVAADGLLYLADYRAAERAFQTLTQVAGRAGRGEEPGKVIIQTYTPEHPVIQAVERHDYTSFTEAELEQRADLNYPPYGRLVLLRFSSPESETVEKVAESVAERLQELQPSLFTEVLGPAPANIMRVANRYRWQILLKLTETATLKVEQIDEWRSLCPPSVSLTVDIDPLNMM